MEDIQTNAILQDFGLNDKEIKVYLANLRIGQAKVNDIAKQSGVLRETAYFILNSLIRKGLVSYVIKSGVKYFEAASPNKLLSILKEKEERIRSLMPSLLQIESSVREKAKVEFYEGKEGLKTVIDDFINTRKEIMSFSSTASMTQKLQFYFPTYILRRVKAKIHIRLLTEKSKETEELKSRDKKELRETRFIGKKYDFPNAIFVYGNKVAILDLERNLGGILIQDEDLNKSFKALFNMIWDFSS